uniref:HECT-type E3 ubiquitin transferase n=1 Tax=Spongospora subterranea TaxID=70186 RepID=A0A0H5QKZ2_9EUKA|eukprot:CRZ02021.1 hypothetical protein [Spongospora subterranea]
MVLRDGLGIGVGVIAGILFIAVAQGAFSSIKTNDQNIVAAGDQYRSTNQSPSLLSNGFDELDCLKFCTALSSSPIHTEFSCTTSPMTPLLHQNLAEFVKTANGESPCIFPLALASAQQLPQDAFNAALQMILSHIDEVFDLPGQWRVNSALLCLRILSRANQNRSDRVPISDEKFQLFNFGNSPRKTQWEPSVMESPFDQGILDKFVKAISSHSPLHNEMMTAIPQLLDMIKQRIKPDQGIPNIFPLSVAIAQQLTEERFRGLLTEHHQFLHKIIGDISAIPWPEQVNSALICMWIMFQGNLNRQKPLPEDLFINEKISQSFINRNFLDHRNRNDEFIRQFRFVLNLEAKEYIIKSTLLPPVATSPNTFYFKVRNGKVLEDALKLEDLYDAELLKGTINVDLESAVEPVTPIRPIIHTDPIPHRQPISLSQFFKLICDDLCKNPLDMFAKHEPGGYLWFNRQTKADKVYFYRLGMLIGAALYHDIRLDVKFLSWFYRGMVGLDLSREVIGDWAYYSTVDNFSDFQPFKNRFHVFKIGFQKVCGKGYEQYFTHHDFECFLRGEVDGHPNWPVNSFAKHHLKLPFRLENTLQDKVSILHTCDISMIRHGIEFTRNLIDPAFFHNSHVTRGIDLNTNWSTLESDTNRRLFFELISDQMTNHMFVENPTTGYIWFNHASPSSAELHHNLYYSLGVLIGSAFYHNVQLDLKFPPCFYKGMLDLEWENDYECSCPTTNILSETITTSDPSSSSNTKVVPVYVMVNLAKARFTSFKIGFEHVCGRSFKRYLTPEDLQIRLCGHFSVMRRLSTYEGYAANDPTVSNFWKVLSSFTIADKQRFAKVIVGQPFPYAGAFAGLKTPIFVTSSYFYDSRGPCLNLAEHQTEESIRKYLQSIVGLSCS